MSRIQPIGSVLFLSGGLFAAVPYAAAETILESFEVGLGPWTDHGYLFCQTPPGCPELEYSATRSQVRAHDGLWSLDITANGLHDDGTAWIQRAIRLTPGPWEIGLEFQLYSEPSAVNNWQVVGYLGASPPLVEEDFTIIGETGIGGWSAYGLEQTIVVNEPSTIYVALGYNIVWETWRTYWFDSVTISGVPAQPHPEDINRDGVVDTSDLLLLLSAWGGYGNADVNGDGVVDVQDLLLLLAAWGP